MNRAELEEMIGRARGGMTARRVFGDPIERDGVTVIPVATVMGGGGVGKREPDEDEGEQEGTGIGFGLIARPAGVYVIKGDDVSWQPAVDVNRAIIGGQIVGAVAILSLGITLRAWLRHRHATQD